MNQGITFGTREAVTLMINLICTKLFLNFPRVAAEIAGPAAWLLVIYIAALAFGLFYIISNLYSRFEGKDILDIGEHCFGDVGRIVIGLITCLFLFAISSLVLREFSENMKTIAFTRSPISFITLIFVACIIAASYFGIAALIRLHAFWVPIIVVSFMVIIIAVLPESDMGNMYPVLGNGAGNIFGKGFFFLSSFAEFIILFLIAPFIKDNKQLKKIGYTSLAFSTFFFLSGAIAYISAIPYPVGTEYFLPVYELARLIGYGRYAQRIESLFVVIWAASAFLYLSANFFFIIYTFKKTFKLEYYKPLILPFAVIIFTTSLLPQSLMDAVLFDLSYYNTFAWAITFGVTLFLLIIGYLKNKKDKKVINNEV